MPNHLMDTADDLLADFDRPLSEQQDGPEMMSQLDSSISEAIEQIDNVVMDNISQNQMTSLNQEQLDTEIGEELDMDPVKPTDSFDF